MSPLMSLLMGAFLLAGTAEPDGAGPDLVPPVPPGPLTSIPPAQAVPLGVSAESLLAPAPPLPGGHPSFGPPIKRISQPLRGGPDERIVVPGDPVVLFAEPFWIHLTGVAADAKQVVIYLDKDRIGHVLLEPDVGGLSGEQIEAAKKASKKLEDAAKEQGFRKARVAPRVIPKQGYVLQAWVLQEGGPVAVPPVVIHFIPRGQLEKARPLTGTDTGLNLVRALRFLLGFLSRVEPPAPVPPREPFLTTPAVDLVPEEPPIDASSDRAGARSRDYFYPQEAWWWKKPAADGTTPAATGLRYRSYYFETPAHFGLPRFTEHCPLLPDEGLVIHEGMRFFATSDGRYEVQFAATAPGMPVTVRLQLIIARTGGEFFTLTLPPIRIEPEKDARGMLKPDTWHVRHVGWSREVHRYFGQLQTVQRQGAARFGSPPPP